MKIKAVALALFLFASMPFSSQAQSLILKLKAPALQSLLQCAGLHSEIIPAASDSGSGLSLYIDDLRGVPVVIGFPEKGIGRDCPFYLEINGSGGFVQLSSGGLVQMSGDRRLAGQGIFGTIECVFSTVFNMIEGVFDSLLKLDILGMIEFMFNGILGIFGCILF